MLTPLRDSLADLQRGQCFYCQTVLHAQSEVDHFIPWARYPRDLGHNFVLAHRACNHAKRDLLADIPHLERWTDRNSIEGNALKELFGNIQMQYEADTSMRVAEWCYSSVEEAGGLVWSRKQELVPLRRTWRSALGL